MADTLNVLDFANGDVNYVAKHNANNAELRAKVNPLLAQDGGGLLGVISFGYFLAAICDGNPVLIGYDSYKCTGSGAALTVDSGTAWKPSTQTIVQFAGPATIDFTGLPADTYYLSIDTAGAPSRTTDSSEAFYSVVWDGANFGDITRLANCFMTAAEEQALLHSTALSADFPTLLARLENIEASISGGTVTFPGPYADDAAAATAGVAIGNPYYQNDGFVVVRTS